MSEDAALRADVELALSTGVAPTILWGRSHLTVPTSYGTWRTPDWLTVDRLLVEAHRLWKAALCPGCGKPLASHAGKTAADYAAFTLTCPTILALDARQVEYAHSHGNPDAEPNPTRADTWLTGTHAEAADLVAGIRTLTTPREAPPHD